MGDPCVLADLTEQVLAVDQLQRPPHNDSNSVAGIVEVGIRVLL